MHLLRKALPALCGVLIFALAQESRGAKIDVGWDNACAIRSGALYCWGSNSGGKLGDGTTVDRPLATAVLGMNSGVEDISVGPRHTCAVRSGEAWCWGSDGHGALGNGDEYTTAVPGLVQGLPAGSVVVSISAGPYHTCAILSGGVACWGSGVAGQLGQADHEVPTAVPGLEPGAGHQVTDVAAGDKATCAVEAGGVLCWGKDYNGQLGNGPAGDSNIPTWVTGLPAGSGITKVDLGIGKIACATGSDGIQCWGLQTPISSSQIPVPVPASEAQQGVSGITSLSAGAYHSCVAADGGARCWGEGKYGALGHGGAEDFDTANLVSGLGIQSGVMEVAAGANASCALLADDSIRCWGENHYGGIGRGFASVSTVPVDVLSIGTGITQIAPGTDHTCAVRNAGAYCWGSNAYGQLGIGQSVSFSIKPQAVAGQGVGTGVTAIDAGEGFACLRAGADATKCWGTDDDGRLGNGSALDDSNVPSAVVGNYTQVSAGEDFGCGLSAMGNVWCWGDGDDGKLGNASEQDQELAQSVVDGDGVAVATATFVSAGHDHACAISLGEVLCWGDNNRGQLGVPDDQLSGRSFAAKVTTIPDDIEFVAVAAGEYHTCALGEGKVWCWGGLTNDDSPKQIPLADISQITAGDSFTCARTMDGSACCWGENSSGQLGDGTRESRDAPAAVLLDEPITDIAAGKYHTCAVLASGTAKCWGEGFLGTLGNGYKGFHLSPEGPVIFEAVFEDGFEQNQ